MLRKNKIWVACQTDDDLPYVLKYSGDDMLVIGTDYGHNDTSSEILALRKLKEDGDDADAGGEQDSRRQRARVIRPIE